jgi:hypothetical protein
MVFTRTRRPNPQRGTSSPRLPSDGCSRACPFSYHLSGLVWRENSSYSLSCPALLRTAGSSKTDTATYSFETQLFCNDEITETVYNSVAPYTSRVSSRDTFNSTDRVYNFIDCTTGSVGGNELLMVLNANTTRAVASYSLVLDLTAVGPGACVGVTDGGINEGTSTGGGGGTGSGGGGTPPGGGGGTPPTGTPPMI